MHAVLFDKELDWIDKMNHVPTKMNLVFIVSVELSGCQQPACIASAMCFNTHELLNQDNSGVLWVQLFSAVDAVGEKRERRAGVLYLVTITIIWNKLISAASHFMAPCHANMTTYCITQPNSCGWLCWSQLWNIFLKFNAVCANGRYISLPSDSHHNTTKNTVLIPNFPLASVYCYSNSWRKIQHKPVAVF